MSFILPAIYFQEYIELEFALLSGDIIKERRDI
jgi:hypothetical protein